MGACVIHVQWGVSLCACVCGAVWVREKQAGGDRPSILPTTTLN